MNSVAIHIYTDMTHRLIQTQWHACIVCEANQGSRWTNLWKVSSPKFTRKFLFSWGVGWVDKALALKVSRPVLGSQSPHKKADISNNETEGRNYLFPGVYGLSRQTHPWQLETLSQIRSGRHPKSNAPRLSSDFHMHVCIPLSHTNIYTHSYTLRERHTDTQPHSSLRYATIWNHELITNSHFTHSWIDPQLIHTMVQSQ